MTTRSPSAASVGLPDRCHTDFVPESGGIKPPTTTLPAGAHDSLQCADGPASAVSQEASTVVLKPQAPKLWSRILPQERTCRASTGPPQRSLRRRSQLCSRVASCRRRTRSCRAASSRASREHSPRCVCECEREREGEREKVCVTECVCV